MEIYHQLGHNYKWNIHSIFHDGTGDGVIIAPRSMDIKHVIDLDLNIKDSAIFDPQFFFPDTPKQKLTSYDFFPGIVSDDFDTTEYTHIYAESGAQRCVDFQMMMNFRYITIPCRYVGGAAGNFIDQQERLFVNPFASALRGSHDKKVLLQVVLHADMLKTDDYRATILNWITGIDIISGVYLIIDGRTSVREKQIKSPDLLYAALKFIDALVENELDVVVGYTNTEALLLSIASPSIVTLGSYEATRIFKKQNFEDDSGSSGRSPRPRAYSPLLLQWIDHEYVDTLTSVMTSDVFGLDNKYNIQLFTPTRHWHFNNPELYKHYFVGFSQQLRQAASFSGQERFRFVRDIIEGARSHHSQIMNEGIALDEDSDGSHLPAWLTAANRFARGKGWL